MSEFIGLTLALDGADKAQSDLRAVGAGLKGLGPASDAGARKATAALGSMGMSANATAAALRNVPAQFTDIVVSLQSGQAPLTVLLQQGGQLKDMFGGIAPAARALGGYIVGLISPITLLAAGVVALGAAYYQGSQEQDAFQRAIVMTGNRAGVTAGQLAEMAKVLGQGGRSQGGAADALAQLAETGRVGRDNLQAFAAVAMDLEKSVGIPVKNTVKDFAELGKAPLQASIRLHEQYGYLTTATLAQIKALQDEGRAQEAAAMAQQAYADAMGGRTREMVQNLGYVERAWNAIKSAVVAAGQAMAGVGRPQVPSEELEKLRARLAARETQARMDGNDPSWEVGNEKLRRRIAELEGAPAKAEAAAKTQAINDAGIASFQAIDKLTEQTLTKQEQLNKALKDYRRNLDDVRAARDQETDSAKRAAFDEQLNPAAIARVEANIRSKYADKSGDKMGAATRRLDLSELQADMRQEQAMVRQQQQQLDIQRSAGLVSLQDYYAQQRALIEKNAKVETDALQAQLDRLDAEQAKGADAINVKRKMVEVRGQLDLRQIQTQNELAAADQRSTQAIRQHESAMRQLTISQGAYVDQLRRRADEQVASEGMGERRRAYAQGLSSIRENYLQQMRQLEDQRGTAATWTPENEQYYQERLRRLKEQQAAEIAIYGETYDRIGAMQADWRNGAIRAMEDYATSGANVARQTADAFTSGMRGMEDALVQFATKGKADFKGLANAIIAEIIRIQVRAALSGIFGNLLMGGWQAAGVQASGAVTSPVAGWGSVSGTALQPLPHAKGGVYDSPSLSLYRNQVHDTPRLFAFARGGVFGEAGPEAIMPLTRGADGNLGVRAFSGGSGGGGADVVVNVITERGMQAEKQSRTAPDGTEIVDVFVKQAVIEVAGQITGNRGPVGQAMRARSRMGME